MSSVHSAKRRGEWLEITPGKLKPAEGGSRYEAALLWLAETLGFPPKLQRTLESNGGIKLAGDRLRLHLFPPRTPQYEPYEQELTILYEDDFCLVVHKPAGIKVHPDGEGSLNTLANLVAALYASRGESVACGHVHRLDEYTSGPVLYAKNEYAQLKLDEAMRRKEIERTYIAIVQGQVDSSLRVIEGPVGKDRHHPKRRRVSPTGKPAVTRVELLETYPRASLVSLKLETGRTHQIRVHMSFAGHPLIGDELYGGSTQLLSYQALHGISLSFAHPLTGEMVDVDDPWPMDLLEVRRKLISEIRS